MVYFLGLIVRCKDEFFIKEFCDYYISQGIDKIFIIDDDSNDKSIYKNIINNKIFIIYEKNILSRNYVNVLYRKIKKYFKWMIFVDVDEFIVTKKNIKNTIRNELKTTFKNIDCVKVPWVLMACNKKKYNPKSILLENTYRWNHDKRHQYSYTTPKFDKFKCRYNTIEVKSIFKTQKFKFLTEHHPIYPVGKSIVIDSINKKNQDLTPYYNNLREHDIDVGYLLCYHYRMISHENCVNKLKNSHLYKTENIQLNHLLAFDFPEITDKTLRYKTFYYMKKKILLINLSRYNSFKKILGFKQIFQKPCFNNENNYIIFLENPIIRFIMAFCYSKFLMDCSNKEHNSQFYEKLISFFNSPNHLAESLTSQNNNMRMMAHQLLDIENIGYIHKGIGWYLYNGNFIKKFKNNIIFCGDINIEHMDNENKYFSLLFPKYSFEHFRRNSNNLLRPEIFVLSKSAVRNIKTYFKNDYETLEILVKNNFISKKTFDEYQIFEEKSHTAYLHQ